MIEHSWCAPYLEQIVAGLHAHRARSAQRGERASRTLRRDGRPRQRRCPSRLPRRLARNWSAPGCRAFPWCSPPRRPMPHSSAPSRRKPRSRSTRTPCRATPLPRGRRRGGHRLLRQHGVSSQPLRRALLPAGDLAAAARPLAAAGLAAGGEESRGGAALHRAATRESKWSDPYDDAVCELARSRVAVVPLLSGSGTRLKILEAWAAGLPVVSTTLGAEGLPVRDGETVLLADDAEAFAAAVTRLLTCTELRHRIGSAGRLLLEKEFTWETAWKKLDL